MSNCVSQIKGLAENVMTWTVVFSGVAVIGMLYFFLSLIIGSLWYEFYWKIPVFHKSMFGPESISAVRFGAEALATALLSIQALLLSAWCVDKANET